MKKRIWIDALIYLIAMVLACLVNLAVCAMAVKIVNLFIVVDYFSAAVVRTVMSFVTLCGVLGALAYYESYKSAEFYLGRAVGSMALAGVGHLALSIPLMFYPFIAGGTRYLAGLIDMGDGFNSLDKVKEIYLWTYLAAFFIYLAVEILTVAVCGSIGKRRRIAQRANLTTKQV